jgi:hypothetical protein
MPIVRMPNGDQVRFPDDMPKDEIKAKIQSKFPELAPKSTGETALDAGIALGSGITKAAASIPSLPADIASGGRWLMEQAGASPEAIQRGRDYISRNPIASGILGASRAYRDELENPTMGVTKALKGYMDYKPETTVGDYAKTTGEFAMGLIGPKQGMIGRAAKYVAAPALASEGLGQLTEGTKFEPAARLAGGLLGPMAVRKVVNPLGEASALSKLEKADDYKRRADAAYDILDKSNITITNSKMSGIWNDLENHLSSLNFAPGVQRGAGNALNYIQNQVVRGGHGQPPMRFRDVEGISQSLGQFAKDAETKGDRRILYAAKRFWDDAIQNIDDTGVNIPPLGLPNGMIERVQGAIKDAKKNWLQKSKIENLDEMVRLGELTGHTAYTRGGTQLGTQREFLKFLKKPENKRQTYDPAELSAMTRVAAGTPGSRALRDFGRLASSGAGAFRTAMNAGTVGTVAGLPLGVGAPVVGAIAGITAPLLARIAANASKRQTAKAIADAQSLIRSGKPLPRAYKSMLGKLMLMNGLRNQVDAGETE